MSVYYKENPDYLRQSMNSMLRQTVLTDDFVLVCDGPLTPELDSIIDEMRGCFGPALNVLRLPVNGGLGNALNQGIKLCKNEIVARMDSDDIAFPGRCEKQIRYLKEKNADFLSAGVLEFNENVSDAKIMRVPPETNGEIIRFAKKRNPINHPCSMYKKSAVEAVGGYQDFYLLEDYYLWIRMLLKGFTAYNIQEPLLYMRAGSDMYRRRSGGKYARSQRKLFKFMRENGFISEADYLSSCCIRTLSAMAPNWLRKFMFKTILRKQNI